MVISMPMAEVISLLFLRPPIEPTAQVILHRGCVDADLVPFVIGSWSFLKSRLLALSRGFPRSVVPSDPELDESGKFFCRKLLLHVGHETLTDLRVILKDACGSLVQLPSTLQRSAEVVPAPSPRLVPHLMHDARALLHELSHERSRSPGSAAHDDEDHGQHFRQSAKFPSTRTPRLLPHAPHLGFRLFFFFRVKFAALNDLCSRMSKHSCRNGRCELQNGGHDILSVRRMGGA